MKNFDRETLRRAMLAIAQQHFPHEVIAFDYIWDAIWQVQQAKCVSDFRDGTGWSYKTDSIKGSGVSGGAFSSELAQILTYYLYVAAVLEENGDMIADVDEFIRTDSRAPLLSEKTQRFLTQHGEAGLYALSNAIEGNFDQAQQAFEGMSGKGAHWYKYTLPESTKIVTGKLPESKLSSLVAQYDFELVVDEIHHRVHRRVAGGKLDNGVQVRDISANALGMLWLLITKCEQNYIDVLDFELVRASKPDGKPIGYRNFTNLFGMWIGREIAKTWHGEHVHGRIEVFTESISFLWIQKDPDPDKSCLLSKAYRS